MSENNKPYHHGDLRNSILNAGLNLLEVSGVSGFSLRAVAKMAGVSPAAPTHHFGNITGIFSSLAAIGFNQLNDAIQSELNNPSNNNADSHPISKMAKGYLTFSTDKPALFSLMFDCEKLDWEQPDLAEASAQSLVGLNEVVGGQTKLSSLDQEFTSPHALPEMLAVWGIVHGFAHLLIQNQISYFIDETSEMEFAQKSLEKIIRLLLK